MIDWKNETVIITGGAGFIGSQLCEMLAALGATMDIYDNMSRGCVSNIMKLWRCGAVRSVHDDDLRGTMPLFREGAVVFHLAARVTNIASNRKDHLGMLQDNLRINANVTEMLRKRPPKLAILVSTVCVYPHDAPVPTPEGAGWPLHPEETNEGYGIAKGVLEKQAEFLHRELGIPVVVPRFSNAIGLRDYYDDESSHVCAALIKRILSGEDPLRVWGSGNQTRAFVDSRDICRALIALAECEAAHDARPVNIGHSQEISICELAYLIADICYKLDLRIQFDISHPDGHARRAVDNSRLHSLIGWTPDRPLRDTLEDMVREYQTVLADWV